MSRSGYADDYNNDWQWICWRGAVASAFRGKRGQVFLREMLSALDSLESKRLIADEMKTEEGEVCAIGAVGVHRRIDMSNIDSYDYTSLAESFGIARAMAQEIMYMNDEVYYSSPEERYQRMRAWIVWRVINGTDL